MGWVQPGTRRGTLRQMIGSRKITPPRMLRIVPLGRAPHLLEAELLDPRLVGGDRGAFHADADFLDLVGRVDGDLVVGAVALLDPEVVVEQVDVEIGQDQLLLDEVPDDPGHLVAVELDDGVVHLDLRHRGPSDWLNGALRGAIAQPGGRWKAVCRGIPAGAEVNAGEPLCRRAFSRAAEGGTAWPPQNAARRRRAVPPAPRSTTCPTATRPRSRGSTGSPTCWTPATASPAPASASAWTGLLGSRARGGRHAGAARRRPG